MFKNKYFWLALIFILLAFLGGLTFAYLRPLAEPLNVVVNPTATVSQPTLQTAAVVPAPVVQSTATATPLENCGHTGVSTTLFLARDITQSNWPPGADVIRFIRTDYSQKKVTILAIPRDLWLITPVLADQNIDHSRLGLVFYRVEQDTLGDIKEKYLAATNALAQTLYDNFEVTPDNYIFFEMTYFAQAIDQLGGLNVFIPRDISYAGNTFVSGSQNLTGERALMYSRLLPGNELSEGWDRLDRQDIVLKALRDKVLDPTYFLKIPGLVDKFWDNILTDFSPALIKDMICMLKEVPSENISMVEVDRSMITGPGPDSSMIPDVDMVKKFIQDTLAP